MQSSNKYPTCSEQRAEAPCTPSSGHKSCSCTTHSTQAQTRHTSVNHTLRSTYTLYTAIEIAGPKSRRRYRYRLPFFMLRRAFLSFPSVWPASSAFLFVPADADADAALVFTDTSVDLPDASPDAIFATCASAALQSAAESLIAYL